ncbi:YoaK family protein [Bifidobacterium psychraerophilum]|uniref:DUF1275 domain-containing protein n=2 Tax=Bifidobacterium psychraerophilum TaxID=218140 RepID=A0A087CLU2_9BIFI|nr:YoaK family protein [Bifidobacterium psychraerophilum]KFI84242.1 hypothetical protein BPSY_0120 [Bifidobacterium psychraerophilum]PKA94099.1 uncharacterized membrane protein YoaK (UPF0700 family) [Bifidobacterium psychraerophilum DSM 22366]
MNKVGSMYRAVLTADKKDGPLPLLLAMLTFVTGLVDAFSYLLLGRVFVANITGSLMFLGFALGGAPGFFWKSYVLALIPFLLAAASGGLLIKAFGRHRGRHLLSSLLLQDAVVCLALIVALMMPLDRPYATEVLTVLLAVAFGLQNSTVRALRVPDMTTTVLTLTMTGIASDWSSTGSGRAQLGRRSASIVSMFAGAIIGAVIIRYTHYQLVLIIAVVVISLCAILAIRLRNSTAPWTRRRPA